ncbi:tetraspanin-9-like [Zerene cesonia]|uniref:tetraspanin-9-like n=1 Tax=Zerene cesonia TaxID=33412 RepID=UPI0018E52F68|nr:tetraspanin-9-like [Zerene cesonia]
MRSSALVLFVCAGLLLSGGAILGVSTSWNLFRMSYYFWTTDVGVELGASILFIAGALLCLPACWLASLVPYYPKSISILSTLMVLVTAALVLLSTGMTSIMALSKATRDPSMIKTSMLRAMSVESQDLAVKNAFAAMQIELKCCGVNSYSDWSMHRRGLPSACCGRVMNVKSVDRCEYPLYNVGCLRPAVNELRLFVNSLSVLTCSIICVMAVTLFATAYTLVTGVADRTKTLQPLRRRASAPPASPRPAPAPPRPCGPAPPRPAGADKRPQGSYKWKSTDATGGARRASGRREAFSVHSSRSLTRPGAAARGGATIG